MLISVILAWLTVVFAALAAFKFIARKSGNKKLNKAFHNVHIPFGVLMVVTGVLHAVFAGNPASATLADFTPGAVLFSLNWGTACLLCGIGLALTYVFRKKLKKHWMTAHRSLTVAMLLCLVLHIASMGITLPSFFTGSSDAAETQLTETVSDEPSAEASSSAAAASDAAGETADAAVSAATSDTSDAAASGTSSDSTGSASSSGSSASSSSSSASSSGSVVTFSGATLTDGTYEGSAEGYSGTTTVSATVSGGKVTAIDVVSESDSPQFFSRAEAVLDTIISGQTLEVDTVSNATFSSAGLINATYNALQKAVSSGTLQVTSIDLSSVRRGH